VIVERDATTGYAAGGTSRDGPGDTPRTRRDDDGGGEPWRHAQGEWIIVSNPVDEFDPTDYDTPHAVATAAAQSPVAHGLDEFTARELAIESLRQKYGSLAACGPPATPLAYDTVRVAIGELRTLRTDIEKRRKELKKDALEWGKTVDGEAKRLTAAIEAIEDPLKAVKQIVDDEREQKRLAAEQAERDRIAEIERQKLEAENQRLLAERQAEEARLAAVRAEEDGRLRAENERLTLERIAQAQERAELDAARRAIDDMRRANEQAEADRQTAIRVERETRERIERERVEAAKRQRLLEAMQPDAAKLRGYAVGIRRVVAAAPRMDTWQARDMLEATRQELARIADDLDGFGGGISPPAHDAKHHTLDDL
jgi:DNA repair exonuclease SbcCD ATPase subunit